MKKSLIIPLLLSMIALGFINCSVVKKDRIVGNYRSECYHTGFPMLEIEFYSDQSFIYLFSHYPDTISGTWQIKKDTLFLDAEVFKIETVSFEEFIEYIRTHPDDDANIPEVVNGQYTTAKGRDIYLIRGKKLHPMRNNGFSKDNCSLKKLKKNDIPI